MPTLRRLVGPVNRLAACAALLALDSWDFFGHEWISFLVPAMALPNRVLGRQALYVGALAAWLGAGATFGLLSAFEPGKESPRWVIFGLSAAAYSLVSLVPPVVSVAITALPHRNGAPEQPD